MFAKVLVPLDGSTLAARGLPHVAALAQHDAEVVLLRVVTPAGEDQVVDPLEWRVRRDVAESYLEHIAAELREHTQLRPSTRVLEGQPAEKILQTAKECGADLMVLTSHGTGGLNGWNLNSVAFKVAARAGISLLVVRSYRLGGSDFDESWRPEQYRRILIPLDGSLRSEHVLPAADRLAARQDASLVLTHVVIEPPSIQRRSQLQHSDLQRQAQAESVELARDYLTELAGGLKSRHEVQILRDQDAAAALHQFVEHGEVDLVIASAHGHSGQRAWPHGSLATSFVLHGGTPLLILQDVAWEDLEPSKAELASRSTPAPGVHAGGAESESAERVQARGPA